MEASATAVETPRDPATETAAEAQDTTVTADVQGGSGPNGKRTRFIKAVVVACYASWSVVLVRQQNLVETLEGCHQHVSYMHQDPQHNAYYRQVCETYNELRLAKGSKVGTTLHMREIGDPQRNLEFVKHSVKRHSQKPLSKKELLALEDMFTCLPNGPLWDIIPLYWSKETEIYIRKYISRPIAGYIVHSTGSPIKQVGSVVHRLVNNFVNGFIRVDDIVFIFTAMGFLSMPFINLDIDRENAGLLHIMVFLLFAHKWHKNPMSEIFQKKNILFHCFAAGFAFLTAAGWLDVQTARQLR